VATPAVLQFIEFRSSYLPGLDGSLDGQYYAAQWNHLANAPDAHLSFMPHHHH
jgi:hypothetical protein